MMTLWQRILQGVTAFWVETIINLIAGVLGARLVFHYLQPADYGRLALFLSFYATGTICLGFGLGGVFTAEIARARGTGEGDWANFLISRYSALLLTTATLFLFLFVGIGVWRGELLWSIMGAYLWLTAPNNVAYTLFHSSTRYRRLAGQSITRSLSRLALLATLPWWWPGEPLVGVALTFPLMELAVLAVSLILARVVWPELCRVSTIGYSYKDMLTIFKRQGLYATLSIPVKKVGDQLPVWLLGAMAGDAELGIYAAAQRGYLLVFAFFRSLETTLFPLVAEQIKVDKERMHVALRQVQKYSFWLGLLAVATGNIAAPWIIRLIAGELYTGTIPVFRVILFLLMLYAFTQIHRPLFYALGQQKWLFLIYLMNLPAYALILWVGITLWGALGAAASWALDTIVIIGLRQLVLYRLALHVWIDPRSVLAIDPFDKRLWEILRQRVSQWIVKVK
jgi:O-antigen/teichoic acid export membrane protein